MFDRIFTAPRPSKYTYLFYFHYSIRLLSVLLHACILLSKKKEKVILQKIVNQIFFQLYDNVDEGDNEDFDPHPSSSFQHQQRSKSSCSNNPKDNKNSTDVKEDSLTFQAPEPPRSVRPPPQPQPTLPQSISVAPTSNSNRNHQQHQPPPSNRNSNQFLSQKMEQKMRYMTCV